MLRRMEGLLELIQLTARWSFGSHRIWKMNTPTGCDHHIMPGNVRRREGREDIQYLEPELDHIGFRNFCRTVSVAYGIGFQY